jgi:hypothetical protein
MSSNGQRWVLVTHHRFNSDGLAFSEHDGEAEALDALRSRFEDFVDVTGVADADLVDRLRAEGVDIKIQPADG